jgi:AcrR family transcriptional regulator
MPVPVPKTIFAIAKNLQKEYHDYATVVAKQQPSICIKGCKSDTGDDSLQNLRIIMDLRTRKTLSAIEDAFLSMREGLPIEKIKISDLCQKAKINKSTFYRHYADIFALSEDLENELIDRIIRDFTSVDSLYSNTRFFIDGLLKSILRFQDTLLVLFDGRINILAEKMEERLKKVYLGAEATVEERITLSFLIGGSVHVFLSQNDPLAVKAQVLATQIGKITR